MSWGRGVAGLEDVAFELLLREDSDCNQRASAFSVEVVLVMSEMGPVSGISSDWPYGRCEGV